MWATHVLSKQYCFLGEMRFTEQKRELPQVHAVVGVWWELCSVPRRLHKILSTSGPSPHYPRVMRPQQHLKAMGRKKLCFKNPFSFNLARSHKCLALLMPLKPKGKWIFAKSKKSSCSKCRIRGNNNKKAFGYHSRLFKTLAVPVDLFWKQDSLFDKWLYFALFLSDTRLQFHHSAEETDRKVILIAGFDKAERKFLICTLKRTCMTLSNTDRCYGRNS